MQTHTHITYIYIYILYIIYYILYLHVIIILCITIHTLAPCSNDSPHASHAPSLLTTSKACTHSHPMPPTSACDVPWSWDVLGILRACHTWGSVSFWRLCRLCTEERLRKYWWVDVANPESDICHWALPLRRLLSHGENMGRRFWKDFGTVTFSRSQTVEMHGHARTPRGQIYILIYFYKTHINDSDRT